MKYFKKMIIIFTLLICVIPNNIVKADEEDIMLTEAAYKCIKCAAYSVTYKKNYYTNWDPYTAVPCKHKSNGFDVTYRHWYVYYKSCNECGWSETISQDKYDERTVCEGYN